MRTSSLTCCVLGAFLITLTMLTGGCQSAPAEVSPVTSAPTGERTPGAVIWHDLVTSDLDASKSFYGGLFGWTFVSYNDRSYHLVRHNGVTIGGMVDVSAEGVGQRKGGWICSVSVEDVDAAAGRVRSQGGVVVQGPETLPGRGYVAIVRDVNGAVLSMLRSNAGDPPRPTPTVGRWVWHENVSDQSGAALNFYRSVLGLASERIEVPGRQPYNALLVNGQPVAGVVQNPFDTPFNSWVPYVLVQDVAASARRAASLGGRIVIEPSPAVREGMLAVVQDPTGATIALQQAR